MTTAAVEDFSEYLENTSFRNNTNLRPEGEVIGYTKEMIEEFAKCKADPIYFIENYVHVIHPDRGIVKMVLYDYQHRLIEGYHNNRFVLGLTARQMGKTVSAAAYFVWYIIFNENKSVAILANKQATADEIMSRIRMAYEYLPKWLQVGVVDWNKRSIGLENKSRVFCAATSSSGVRGKTINVLYVDEIAFVQNNLAEDFFTSVYPTIIASTDSKVIMTSTPNGFNHFYKFWNEAEKGINGFVPVRCHWYEMPGRDQKWYDEQVGILGEQKAAQEIDASFLGSSRQLLTSATMARLSYDEPIQTFEDFRKGLLIYKSPTEGHEYAMTVDVSRGRHLDASAFMMFDVTNYPHTIAATYNRNDIAPMMYTNVVHQIAKEYNNAYVLIEINDVGAQVADELYYTLEYGEMFWTKSGDMLGSKGADPYPGIRTTKKTKRIGCANLKDVIEKQQLIVNDFKTIQELSTFVQNDSGSWEADDGFHDDMVACLWLFAWLLVNPWFKDMYDKDIRSQIYDNTVNQMMDELCPFGFIRDGQEDTHVSEIEQLTFFK